MRVGEVLGQVLEWVLLAWVVVVGTCMGRREGKSMEDMMRG